jgi:hypothetical protein
MKANTQSAPNPPTIDGLLAKGATLRKQIADLGRAAVDDRGAITERAAATAELDAIPVMIGELRRREVLEHIQRMAEQARQLAPEVVAARAAFEAFQTESAEVAREIRATADRAEKTRLLGASDRRGREGDKLLSEYQHKAARLDGLYSLAVRTYGVFLDDSERQMLHRAGLPATMTYAAAATQKEWERAAERLGRRAEEEARRSLLANVLRPMNWGRVAA